METEAKVIEKKKVVFRFNQIIWYIFGAIEVFLGFRVLLKLLGANAANGFTSFIYALTEPLAMPFKGILGNLVSGKSILEWSTLFGMIVYLVAAWGLVYLLDLVNPVTPEEVTRV